MADSNEPISTDDLLGMLKPDFPDLTTSKVSFLVDQGFVFPTRDAAGRRTYVGRDVDTLRFILTAQRDEYLPLKVIRTRLRGHMPEYQVRHEWVIHTMAGRRLTLHELRAVTAPASTGDDAPRHTEFAARAFPGEPPLPVHVIAPDESVRRLPDIEFLALLSSAPLNANLADGRSVAMIGWTQPEFTVTEDVMNDVVAHLSWEEFARDVTFAGTELR